MFFAIRYLFSIGDNNEVLFLVNVYSRYPIIHHNDLYVISLTTVVSISHMVCKEKVLHSSLYDRKSYIWLEKFIRDVVATLQINFLKIKGRYWLLYLHII